MKVLVSRETVVNHKHFVSNKLIRVLLLLQRVTRLMSEVLNMRPSS